MILAVKLLALVVEMEESFSALCDVNLIAIAEDTPRIQEMHILIGHTICHLIELEFSRSK